MDDGLQDTKMTDALQHTRIGTSFRTTVTTQDADTAQNATHLVHYNTHYTKNGTSVQQKLKKITRDAIHHKPHIAHAIHHTPHIAHAIHHTPHTTQCTCNTPHNAHAIHHTPHNTLQHQRERHVGKKTERGRNKKGCRVIQYNEWARKKKSMSMTGKKCSIKARRCSMNARRCSIKERDAE